MNNVELEWSQKYRPTSIGEMVLPITIQNRLNKVSILKGGMSMIFHGKPGIGKTTAAKLINPEGTYLVNCAEQTSINKVRELERVCSSMTLFGRRLVLLDEGDHLSKEAQHALRGLIERHSANNDFIMTANDITKVDTALRSRLISVCFDFVLTDEQHQRLIDRLKAIATNEGHNNVDKAMLGMVVKSHYPDIRHMIKRLQYELLLA